MNGIKRSALIGSLLVGVLVSAGCGEGHFGITINSDGSVDARDQMVINQSSQQIMNMIGQNLNDFSEREKKSGFNVVENQGGFTATKHFNSLEDLVREGADVYNPDENHGGVRIKHGFLYDSYSFDLYKKGETLKLPTSNIQPSYSSLYGSPYQRDMEQINQMMNSAMQSAVESAKLDYILNLPYKPISSNADSVSNDGKQLTWDLKKAFINGKDLSIKTDFRVYHERNIIIVSIGAGIILLLGIGLVIAGVIIKDKRDLKRAFLISGIVCIVGSCIAGGYIGYKIYKPEVLDTSYRIVASKATDSSGNKLTDTLKAAEQTKQNSTDDVQTILTKHNVTRKLLACSNFDDNGFIALIEEKGGNSIVVYNKELDYLASVGSNDYDYVMKQFGKASKYGNPKNFDPAIFILFLPHWDHSSPDAKLGKWDKDSQLIPVYVLYHEDESGTIRVDKYYSAETIKPSHYQAQINDDRVKKILDTLMSHYKSLKTDAIKKGVK